MEDRTESLVDSIVGFWGVLGEEKADFPHESNSNFDGIIRWSFKTEQEDLKGDDLMCNVLIDEMGDEGGCCVADRLQLVLTEAQRYDLPCRYACTPVETD